MATELVNVENVDVKIEVKTEDGQEIQYFSHSPFFASSTGTTETNVEEIDVKRMCNDMDPTCLACSSHEDDASLLPQIISERCAKKLERLKYPFSMLQCPQCDKTFKRASLSCVTKHVQERHQNCSKELLSIIQEEFGLHEMKHSLL